jgi:hypothetical protein
MFASHHAQGATRRGSSARTGRFERYLGVLPPSALAVFLCAAGLCAAGCGDDESDKDRTWSPVQADAQTVAAAPPDASVDAGSSIGSVPPPSDAGHAVHEAAVAAADAAAPGVLDAGSDHGHGSDAGPSMMEACSYHGAPDPRDEMITSNNAVVVGTGSNQDTRLPQVVVDWMKEREFAEAHDAWHLIRRWDQGCRKSNAPAAGCRSAERLEADGLWRAEAQQGAPGDGYAFMVMHRHMIHMLKQSFPKHQELFRGFTKVPRTRADTENPMPWRNISWTSGNLTGFDILENIEKNLSKFATEDDLGRFFQVTFRWSAQAPNTPSNEPGSGLHGALHSQWAVFGSPANLIDQKVDVYNFAFWKLHGWADDVWERYRKAKGITEEDATFKKISLEQCREMLALRPSARKAGPAPDAGVPVGNESGVFAREVRPILEARCAGCHGASGAMAGVILGGAGVPSSEIIGDLVGTKASNGQYNLVEAGQPDQSWLYLKASGMSATVACTGACNREKMPPSGTGLSTTELNTIKQWIQSGAGEN